MSHLKTYNFKISSIKKERIDLYLAKELDLTRNYVQKLIEGGFVLVNSKKTRSSAGVKINDEITVHIPEAQEVKELEPQDIPLNIIYEDKYILIINKPPDLVVHPAKGHSDSTLVNAILFHCPDLMGINNELRPGIVHRLDKDTSGVMMIAKTQESHNYLAEQIKDRKVYKEYIALVKGIPVPPEGTINAPIGRHPVNRKKMAVNYAGKEAITHYEVEKNFKGYSLLKLRLETGRTHQIRVHLSHINHPVLGDPVYGGKQKGAFGLTRQALHARKLGFYHLSGKWMEFSVPLTEDIQKIIDKLEES